MMEEEEMLEVSEGRELEEEEGQFGGFYQDSSLMQQILDAKRGDPSQFPSYWELDELDVNEATEEEIANNPVQRALWAAENNHLDILKGLLEGAPDLIQAEDTDKYTPLHRASYNGHAEVVTFLLDQGANIEARTLDGWMPIHSAAYWGNADVVAILLSRGADVNGQTNGKQTPLHLAASNADCRQTLEVLLMDRRVDYTLTNSVGETAKELAQRNCPYHYLFDMTDSAVNKLS